MVYFISRSRSGVFIIIITFDRVCMLVHLSPVFISYVYIVLFYFAMCYAFILLCEGSGNKDSESNKLITHNAKRGGAKHTIVKSRRK